MRYYLLKILFNTNPFEFGSFKVYNPKSATRELSRLENWRPPQYRVLMDNKRAVWTETNGTRNIYIRIPAEQRLPPLIRMHHLFITEVMPYLNRNHAGNSGKDSKDR